LTSGFVPFAPADFEVGVEVGVWVEVGVEVGVGVGVGAGVGAGVAPAGSGCRVQATSIRTATTRAAPRQGVGTIEG
jgi:hypothetical protein